MKSSKKGSKKRGQGTELRAKYEHFRKSRAARILYDKGVLYFLLSFLIPSVIMLFAFAQHNIHPFGSQQMLVVDLWHQYYPFFRVVREKLLTGGSFLYSWENGMGTNFLSLISYYAASPLNWLSVFFSDDGTRDALTFILIAKIGFAGAFFSCFLRYTYQRRDISIVVFSSMFALCSYMLGYYWNVMWFDTVALFPLVMLGVVAICRERKWKLYTLALALSLFSNYYVAYFTCIFTVFMFIFTLIIEGRSIKDYFRKTVTFIVSTLVGAGLAAFMLIPAYLGLKMTYSVNNQFPAERRFYDEWTAVFGNLISYNEPATKEGLPNFACGMLAIVLFGVFLFAGGIKIREKIASVFMLALIAVSCEMNQLNYIWHGFHATNQIPHRFAFIFSFVLVAAAFRAYDAMTKKGIKIYQLLLLLPAPAAVLYCAYYTAAKSDDGFKFEGAFKSSVIIAAAYILIFIAAKLFPFKNQKLRRSVLNLALTATVCAELFSNTDLGVKAVGSSSYDSYPSSDKQVQIMLDVMREDDKSLFSRTEMTSTYTLNDSALYGYYGVSQFSSSANVSVTRFFRRLGLYASEAGNRYYYHISTPVVNDLLGINYIISKSGALNSSEMSLELLDSEDHVYLYRSKYPMSIGFMMDKDILNMQDKTPANPYEYQNEVIRRATGSELNVFVAQPVKFVDYQNINVTKNSFGSYTYNSADPTDHSKNRKAVYTFACLDDGELYGYASNSSIESVDLKCCDAIVENGVSVKDYPISFPMGSGKEGDEASVSINFNNDKTSGTYELLAYALKKEELDLAYDMLADEQFEVTDFSDTEIKGRINAKKGGILYFSIPYEKGWSVYVDGEKVKSVKVLHSMLGADINAGEHEITLKFSPDGFDKGVIISGTSLAALLALIAAEYYYRRKKKQKAAMMPVSVPVVTDGEMEDVSAPEVTNEKPESDDGLPRD